MHTLPNAQRVTAGKRVLNYIAFALAFVGPRHGKWKEGSLRASHRSYAYQQDAVSEPAMCLGLRVRLGDE